MSSPSVVSGQCPPKTVLGRWTVVTRQPARSHRAVVASAFDAPLSAPGAERFEPRPDITFEQIAGASFRHVEHADEGAS